MPFDMVNRPGHWPFRRLRTGSLQVRPPSAERDRYNGALPSPLRKMVSSSPLGSSVMPGSAQPSSPISGNGGTQPA